MIPGSADIPKKTRSSPQTICWHDHLNARERKFVNFINVLMSTPLSGDKPLVIIDGQRNRLVIFVLQPKGGKCGEITYFYCIRKI
jgi:hypothetical protein